MYTGTKSNRVSHEYEPGALPKRQYVQLRMRRVDHVERIEEIRFILFGIETMAGSCGHGNELSGVINDEGILTR
jgi:hypothetical protein